MYFPWWFSLLLILFLLILFFRFFFGTIDQSKFVGVSLEEINKRTDSRYILPIPEVAKSPETSEIIPTPSKDTNSETPTVSITPSPIQDELQSIDSRNSIVSFTEEELEEFYRCKRPFIGRESKGEKACRKFLRKYFGLPFESCRPKFMMNPETNSPLELDCYEGSLRLAVEYQGRQHYYYESYFHEDENDFIQQQRRDELKAELCRRLGIHLIRVPYSIQLGDIPEFIRLRLPQHLLKFRKI